MGAGARCAGKESQPPFLRDLAQADALQPLAGPTLFVKVPNPDFCHIGDKYGDLISEAIENLGLEYPGRRVRHRRKRNAPRRMSAEPATAGTGRRLPRNRPARRTTVPPVMPASSASTGTARRNSTPSTRSTDSSSARATSSRMRPRARWRSGLPKPTTRCSCTVGSAWARRTSCRPSDTRSRSGIRRWPSAMCRARNLPTR